MRYTQTRKNIEISHFDCEIAIRPLISSFVSRQSRISEKEKDLIFSSINNYKLLLLENITGKDVQLKKNIVKIFSRFEKYIYREIVIADKREDLDLKRRFYETIINLNEFMFFTSAVITAYIASPIISYIPVSLPILGIIGLFLYFFNDLTELAIILSLNSKRISISNDIPKLDVKKLDELVNKMTPKETAAEIVKLEDILLSTDPGNILSLNDILLLEKLYFKQIDRGDFRILTNSLENKDIKRGIYLLENLINEYIKLFVLSLSAVDSNRPIPKPINLLSRIFSFKGLNKFIGYVLLNSVTFNFFYNSFEKNKDLIILITIILAIGAFYLISFLEKQFTKEISKLLKNIHERDIAGHRLEL